MTSRGRSRVVLCVLLTTALQSRAQDRGSSSSDAAAAIEPSSANPSECNGSGGHTALSYKRILELPQRSLRHFPFQERSLMDWMPLYARGLSTTTSEQERLRQDVNRKLDKLRDAVHTVDTDGGEKIQGERVEREEKARLEKNAEKVQKLHLRAIALEGLARHVTESRDRNLLVQHGFLGLVFRLVYANSGLGGRFGEALVEGRLTPVEQRDALYVLVKLAQHGNSSLPACEAHRIRPVEEYLLESYLSDFKTDDTRDTRPGVGAMWGKGGGIAPIKALMLQDELIEPLRHLLETTASLLNALSSESTWASKT